jgi:hypothetical protein
VNVVPRTSQIETEVVDEPIEATRFGARRLLEEVL